MDRRHTAQGDARRRLDSSDGPAGTRRMGDAGGREAGPGRGAVTMSRRWGLGPRRREADLLARADGPR